MRNKKLIPFEIIEKAVAGEPEAVDAVLRYYNAHIKYLSAAHLTSSKAVNLFLLEKTIRCFFCFQEERLNCTPCQGHFWFLVSIILDTPLLVPHNWTFRFYCSFGALSFVVCLWHIMPGHRQLPPPLTVPQMDVVSYLPTATNSGTDFTIRPPSDPQS